MGVLVFDLRKPKEDEEKRKKIREAIKNVIVESKIYLLVKYPYLGSIASKLEFVEIDDDPIKKALIPTAATDGKKIYYNVDFFKELNKGNIVFVVAHEILHVILDHIFRMKKRNPNVWNAAVDYIVNYILVKNKIGIIPSNVLYSEKYTDEYSAEELYEILYKEKEKYENYVFDIHLSNDENAENGQNNDNKNKKVVSVSEILGRKLTEEEIEKIRSEIQATLLDVCYTQNTAGNLPLGIERIIKKLIEPKINWREAIKNFVYSSVNFDFDFRKPNHQSWVQNIILPSLNYGMKIDAHVFIDASGSISDVMLCDFLSEIKNIMNSFDLFSLTIASFDTKVYNVKTFTNENESEINNYKVLGGGGTDFNCIFNYLKENNIQPKVLIVFTDGQPFNGWGDPRYCDETIFLINNPYNKDIKAPFGVTLKYEKEN